MTHTGIVRVLSLCGWILFLLPTTKQQQHLQCYACDKTYNLNDCTNTNTCNEFELCSVQEVFAPHGDVYYWAGCENKEECSTLPIRDPLPVIGKRRAVDGSQELQVCRYCCSSSLCNRNCTSLSNLALHKEAFQSSTAYNGTADRAVDGNTAKNYFTGNSCTHTRTGAGTFPWWTVDLGSNYNIAMVKIHERDDVPVYLSRTFHIDILVSTANATTLPRSSTQFTKCGSYYGKSGEGNTITIDCPGGTAGRWVRVQDTSAAAEYLHLCEVEVLGH